MQPRELNIRAITAGTLTSFRVSEANPWVSLRDSETWKPGRKVSESAIEGFCQASDGWKPGLQPKNKVFDKEAAILAQEPGFRGLETSGVPQNATRASISQVFRYPKNSLTLATRKPTRRRSMSDPITVDNGIPSLPGSRGRHRAAAEQAKCLAWSSWCESAVRGCGVGGRPLGRMALRAVHSPIAPETR